MHFTSMVVTSDSSTWYHDGITTRRKGVHIGNINTIDKLSLHNILNTDYNLAVAIYAESSG